MRFNTNMMSYKWLSKLLRKSESPGSLLALQKIFDLKIPFNAPHGIKINKISSEKVVMTLPFKRRNKNHLGTMHACAMATVGEFPAGLLLIKSLDPAQFRVVMTKLEANYHKRAVTKLSSVCEISTREMELIEESLKKNSEAKVEMTSQLTDLNDQAVATIKTCWQLKAWNKVGKR